MTFLLYIGKNKDFLRKFSKLENVQMIYAQNYQDAITMAHPIHHCPSRTRGDERRY